MTGLIDKRLSVLAWAKGFSLWNYWTLDHTEATERGFFNEARDLLATGDIVLASSPVGATMLHIRSDGADIIATPMKDTAP